MSVPTPKDVPAERAVLGSILIRNESLFRVVGTIAAEDFSQSAHRIIFAAMQSMIERGVEVDLLTIKPELQKIGKLDEVGGASYISGLIDGIPDIANVERYAEIVREKAALRSLAKMGNAVMQEAIKGERDAQTLAADAERVALAAATRGGLAAMSPAPLVVREAAAEAEAIQKKGEAITGIASSFYDLDRLTCGFQRSDLIVVAARPAMGKTAFMMNIATDVSMRKDPPRHVAVFSLEMSKRQLGMRMLADLSGTALQKVRSGFLSAGDWEAIARAQSWIAKSNLWIDDTPSITVLELRAKARQMKATRGLDLVLVDYMQLMTVKGKFENRNIEITKISQGLKALAKELDVPVVALAQLSRNPESRSDKRPMLADLRESGSIEQDADVVMFIYRDEVYNAESTEKGTAEIIIAKHRNGPIGTVKLAFLGHLTKFANLEAPMSERVQEDEREMEFA